METLLQDLRYGVRMLRKNPGFTFIAVLTLALGIGANTAIFSVVNAVLLRPLAYREPASLVFVWTTMVSQGVPISGSSMPDYREFRDQNSAFSDIAAFTTSSFNLATAGQEPQRISAARVTASLFAVVGVQPQTGRSFSSDEEEWGRHRVVALGYGLWESRFARDSSIIGKQIRLSGEDYTVVGVMPRGTPFFSNTQPVDVYVPLSFAPDDSFGTRSNYFLRVVARLKPGVTVEQAQAEMTTIAGRIQMQPEGNTGYGALVEPLGERLVGGVRRPLLVLLGAVGFVLLIACANVANLLLARAARREKEFAIRAALGASRVRLIRQSMIESLVLGVIGGGIGLLIAAWSLDLLQSWIPRDLPRFNDLRVDPAVLAFTLAASVLTAMIFGVFPAFHAAKPDIHEALKEGGRGPAEGRRSRRLRPALVVIELAVAMTLLVGAGLMAKSYYRLLQVDPGFEPDGVLTMQIPLPDSKYPLPTLERLYPQKAIAFYEDLLARVGELPGVESAGVTTILPLGYGNGWGKNFTIQGREAASLDQVPGVRFQLSSADYFQTIEIKLREGRFFKPDDNETSPPVAIVNETLARRFFRNEDAVGKVIYMIPPANLVPPPPPGSPVTPRRTIVGVVADVKDASLNQPPFAEVYAPYKQCVGEGWANALRLVVRTHSDPTALAGPIRAQVASLDAEQPVSDVATLDSLVGRSVSAERFNAMLMACFAALALALASVGVYGVVRYSVEQRTHEIGVRMALGARPVDVLVMIMRQAVVLGAAGVMVGLVGATALTRVMSSLLFNVSATDPATFAILPLVLMGLALMASYIPARRATRVDPMIALRYE